MNERVSFGGSLQGDVLTSKCQVDLGDGSAPLPVNLTLRTERIRHRYEHPGVYRVSVRAENAVGHDEAVLFVQVNRKSPPVSLLTETQVPGPPTQPQAASPWAGEAGGGAQGLTW